MNVREIARSDWPEFFNAFSREHCDEPVTVELLTRGFGLRSVARQLPLLGITVGATRPSDIVISVGDAQGERFTRHVVDEPLHVMTDETGGRQTSLLIDSAAGPITLIDLHPRTEAARASSHDQAR